MSLANKDRRFRWTALLFLAAAVSLTAGILKQLDGCPCARELFWLGYVGAAYYGTLAATAWHCGPTEWLQAALIVAGGVHAALVQYMVVATPAVCPACLASAGLSALMVALCLRERPINLVRGAFLFPASLLAAQLALPFNA